MAKALRVGVAGLGFGAGVHLPVFQSIPGAEVEAVLGGRWPKTCETAERFGIRAPCRTLDEFLDQPLDAVVIALPPETTGAVCKAAIERGYAVLAEKPIADTAATADNLAKMTVKHTAVVDFEFRELASFRALKDILDAESHGKVRNVRISWRSLSYAQRNGIWSWKSDAARCGGVLTSTGMHMFNLAEWLFGPVELVEARLSNETTQAFAPAGAAAAEDTADLRLRAGADVSVEMHLCNAAPDNLGHHWEIDTTGGRLSLTDLADGSLSGMTLTSIGPNGRERVVARDGDRDGDYRIGPVSALAQRFVASAAAGLPSVPDFREAARSQAIMETARAMA